MRSRDTLDKPADDDLLRYFPLPKLFFIQFWNKITQTGTTDA